jgi:hypothetical protein
METDPYQAKSRHPVDLRRGLVVFVFPPCVWVVLCVVPEERELLFATLTLGNTRARTNNALKVVLSSRFIVIPQRIRLESVNLRVYQEKEGRKGNTCALIVEPAGRSLHGL